MGVLFIGWSLFHSLHRPSLRHLGFVLHSWEEGHVDIKTVDGETRMRRRHISELELLAALSTIETLYKILWNDDESWDSKDIWLTATYIPGSKNVEADAQSRSFYYNCEWSLNKQLFDEITEIWEVPDIDLFATKNNAKISVFAASKPDPEAQIIYAFSCSWSQITGESLYLYVFVPFSLIEKVTFWT